MMKTGIASLAFALGAAFVTCAAEFATGGGDLWTAEFAQGGNLTNRLKVSAHDAAFFGRSDSDDGEEVLVWRDIPLGGERGVLDAKVTIEKRADGSQAWRQFIGKPF